jgi:hypothetical protein
MNESIPGRYTQESDFVYTVSAVSIIINISRDRQQLIEVNICFDKAIPLS